MNMPTPPAIPNYDSLGLHSQMAADAIDRCCQGAGQAFCAADDCPTCDSGTAGRGE